MSTPEFLWRLYYEDGSTFSDTDGEPWESPPWGSVCCAQPNEEDPSDRVMVNADVLLWRTDLGVWMQCGHDGLEDHLAHYAHVIGCVRKTRWIRTRDFREIWKRARRDCGLKE
jgi:hypothetical protein